MKKLAIAAAVAATFTGAAHAYTMGTFSNGVVVPNVYTDGKEYTAVGIISKDKNSVYWAFFDQDSKHRRDGCFELTANDLHSFIWDSTNATPSNVGVRGYLVFAVGDKACNQEGYTNQGTGTISASAFQVIPPADVAYVPVIDGGLTISGNLRTMGPDSLTVVKGAVDNSTQKTIYMRYFTDNGAKTKIVFWSTGKQKGEHIVQIYDDKQNRSSGTLVLTRDELDVIDVDDVKALIGRPSNFVDGFIAWNVPTAISAAFSYSVIDAPAFGAVQTILNPHN